MASLPKQYQKKSTAAELPSMHSLGAFPISFILKCDPHLHFLLTNFVSIAQNTKNIKFQTYSQIPSAHLYPMSSACELSPHDSW